MIRKSSTAVAVLSAAVLAVAASSANAGKFNQVLDIGDAGPAWEKLPGVDDAKHSLEDLKDAKAVVLVFTCNHCPVAVAYEDRLIAFTKEYEEKGVKVIAINVNKVEADLMPAMKVRAKEKEFNFPYLFDESQEIGRKYGAETTPSLFLLNSERKVVYMGGMDSNMAENLATEKWLRDATDALLAGEEIKQSETRATGCQIPYEPK